MAKMIKKKTYEEVLACERCETKAATHRNELFEFALGTERPAGPITSANVCDGCANIHIRAFTIRRHKKADKKAESAT